MIWKAVRIFWIVVETIVMIAIIAPQGLLFHLVFRGDVMEMLQSCQHYFKEVQDRISDIVYQEDEGGY